MASWLPWRIHMLSILERDTSPAVLAAVRPWPSVGALEKVGVQSRSGTSVARLLLMGPVPPHLG